MTHLRHMLRLYRLHHQRSTEQQAAMMGVPRTTLNRFERGGDNVSAGTLVNILMWMLVEPRRHLKGEGSSHQ